jgi:hypothetical protein
MPVTIKTKSGLVMTVDFLHWTCEAQPDLADDLNKDLDSGTVQQLPGNPAPDWNEARRVLDMVGGEVLSYTPRPSSPKGTVF